MENPNHRIYRFWFEYALLRQTQARRFEDAEDERNRGVFSRLESCDPQFEFHEAHPIVNARSLFDGLVDVGTVCSKDPANATESMWALRQIHLSGRKRWTIQDLKCSLRA